MVDYMNLTEGEAQVRRDMQRDAQVKYENDMGEADTFIGELQRQLTQSQQALATQAESCHLQIDTNKRLRADLAKLKEVVEKLKEGKGELRAERNTLRRRIVRKNMKIEKLTDDYIELAAARQAVAAGEGEKEQDDGRFS